MSAPLPEPASRSERVKWLALLAGLYFLCTLPVVNVAGAGNDTDEKNLHYPAVLLIREHWPKLDLINDCLSPIAPGYHYFLATCSFITGPSLLAMRLVTDVFSLAIPLLVFIWLARYVAARTAFGLTLPLLLCSFFLKQSVRVVTDNAALLCMTLTLLAVFLLPARGWRGTLAGISGGVGVFMRQLTAPFLFLLYAQVLVDKYAEKRGWLEYLPAVVFRLAPLAVIAYLYSVWHGLVAPQWRSTSMTISTAAAAYLLSVAAFLGFFFVLSVRRAIAFRVSDPGVWISLGAGLATAVASPTNYSPPEGRWGGWIWVIVNHLPTWQLRSPVFVVTAPIGALFLYLVARAIWNGGMWRECLLWVAAVISWVTSYLVSTNSYHHYFEPPLMIFFGAAAAMILGSSSGVKLCWWPLVALLGYDLALDIGQYWGGAFMHHGLSDTKI